MATVGVKGLTGYWILDRKIQIDQPLIWLRYAIIEGPSLMTD